MNKSILFIFMVVGFNSFLFSQNEGIKLTCHLEWPNEEQYNKVESIIIVSDYCSIEKLAEVDKLINLRKLTINSFLGSELPILFDFKNLEELNIINCPNLNIEKIFSLLTSDSTLKSIKIISCGLKNVPTEIFEKYSNLEVLELRDNRLKTIEKDLVSSNSLKNLDLSDNDLELISINWGLYMNLKKLNLSNNWELLNSPNKINKFCSNVSDLNIEVLFLNNLGIKDFPCCLNGLHFLKNLHLNFNLIRILPECEGFNSLEILNLTGNKVYDVPEKFIRKVYIYEN